MSTPTPTLFDLALRDVLTARGITSTGMCRAKGNEPSKTPEYGVWKSIRQRCSTPTHRLYALYGARGIKVCERWDASFAAFFDDMGPRPASANTLDRIDQAGDFEPGNCQWVSRKAKNDEERAANPLTAERLRSLLDYDPSTGLFTRKDGQPIGHVSTGGYIGLRIDQRSYRAHRLAWLYVYGEWPEQIDHLNRERADNRIANLRSVSASINMQNAYSGPHGTSPYLGVTWHKVAGKWAAQISLAGERKHLGLFTTPELAHDAYLAAKAELHPDSPITRTRFGPVKRATQVMRTRLVDVVSEDQAANDEAEPLFSETELLAADRNRNADKAAFLQRRDEDALLEQVQRMRHEGAI